MWEIIQSAIRIAMAIYIIALGYKHHKNNIIILGALIAMTVAASTLIKTGAQYYVALSTVTIALIAFTLHDLLDEK